MSDFKAQVQRAARRRILFTRHALDQMNKPDRLITESEVRDVVERGNVIEEYPDDPRGSSGLMGQETALGRFIHVVCSPKSDYLAIVTAYIPDPSEWDDEFRARRK